MKKVVNINGIKKDIKTYNGKRVLTLPDINNLLNLNKYVITKRFNGMLRGKNKPIDNVDYFKIPSEVYMLYGNGNKGSNFCGGGYLITEEGFNKITFERYNDNEYIKQYIVNCYYNDLEPPKKEGKKEDKIKKKEKKEEIIENNNDKFSNLDDVVMAFKQIANAYENLAKSQEKFINDIKNENDRFLSELKKTLDNNKSVIIPDPPLDIEESEEYSDFKKVITNAANKCVAKHAEFKSTNDVLSCAYNALRRDYGVVWEQEKKEFYAKFNRSPVNTLELEWWIERRPAYKNLLIGKLNTIYSKGRK